MSSILEAAKEKAKERLEKEAQGRAEAEREAQNKAAHREKLINEVITLLNGLEGVETKDGKISVNTDAFGIGFPKSKYGVWGCMSGTIGVVKIGGSNWAIVSWADKHGTAKYSDDTPEEDTWHVEVKAQMVGEPQVQLSYTSFRYDYPTVEAISAKSFEDQLSTYLARHL